MITEEQKKEFRKMEKEDLNQSLIDACTNNNLNVVKYLLTSPELEYHADIHSGDSEPFRISCMNGHLEIVRYLLTSPELKNHMDIHVDNEGALRWACSYGHLDIIKYLLTSPELKEHANIHINNDDSFICACEYYRDDVMNYLIFDYKVKITEGIAKHLYLTNKENILNMFEKRALEEKLQQDLQNNTFKNKITITKIKL